MERFIKGDIVVIPFPYSDLTNAKRRPALVLADSSYNNLILCQVTSQHTGDSFSISITDADFKQGKLQKISNIRPNKLFTADESIILYKTGSLKSETLNTVIDRIISIFTKP